MSPILASTAIPYLLVRTSICQTRGISLEVVSRSDIDLPLLTVGADAHLLGMKQNQSGPKSSQKHTAEGGDHDARGDTRRHGGHVPACLDEGAGLRWWAR